MPSSPSTQYSLEKCNAGVRNATPAGWCWVGLLLSSGVGVAVAGVVVFVLVAAAVFPIGLGFELLAATIIAKEVGLLEGRAEPG